MEVAVKLIDDAPTTLPVGAKIYQVGDEYVAVMVDAESPNVAAMLDETMRVLNIDPHMVTRLPRPTEVLPVNALGEPLSMTPLRTFPPGTTHEDALTQLEQE
jgi:hypothetical protein